MLQARTTLADGSTGLVIGFTENAIRSFTELNSEYSCDLAQLGIERTLYVVYASTPD